MSRLVLGLGLIVCGLAAAGTSRPAAAQAQNDIAGLQKRLHQLYDADRLPEARAAAEQLVDLIGKRSGTGSLAYAEALKRLAIVCSAERRFADAETHALRAIAIKEKVLGPEHLEVAVDLADLAHNYVQQGRPADARPLDLRALAIKEKALGPNDKGVAEGLASSAQFYNAQGDHAFAARLYLRAFINRGLETDADGRPWLIEPHTFPRLVETAWQLAGDQSAQRPELQRGAFAAAQWAAHTVTGAALTQMAARYASGKPGLAPLVRESQDLAAAKDAADKRLNSELTSGPIGKRNDALIGSLRAELKRIDERQTALATRLKAGFTDYARLVNPGALDLADVQAQLGASEAMLVLLVDFDHTFVWAVTRDGFAWLRNPVGRRALEASVARLRQGLDLTSVQKKLTAGMPAADALFDLAAAHDLYKTLLGPVENLIAGKDHLFVVPSGPLTSLPFHLLVTAPAAPITSATNLQAYRDAAWLTRRHAVTMLPTVSSLKSLRAHAARGRAERPFIGFGNPLLLGPSGADRSAFAVQGCLPVVRVAGARGIDARTTRAAVATGFASFFRGATADLDVLRRAPPLPDTAEELCTIAASLGAPDSEIYLGARATEATVKKLSASGALARYRIVHFATHGLTAGELKGLAEPALILTPPETASEADDGLLTASEVTQLKLNADWVILSACNTAAGDGVGAEAFSGLARAFIFAGARSLLVSHWPVESTSATRLTTAAFGALARDPKLGRAEAVRRAMNAYIDDASDPWNAYPAFWAPFVVIGEGGAR